MRLKKQKEKNQENSRLDVLDEIEKTRKEPSITLELAQESVDKLTIICRQSLSTSVDKPT